jgi:hypothetical protein
MPVGSNGARCARSSPRSSPMIRIVRSPAGGTMSGLPRFLFFPDVGHVSQSIGGCLSHRRMRGILE